MLNTQQYLEMRHEALRNDGEIAIPEKDIDILFWDTTRYTDWQKELIGGTVENSNVDLNFSGGNSSIRYMVGGMWKKETSVFPGNFSDIKGAVHFNINSNSFNNKFKIDISGSYLVDNNQLPVLDLTRSALVLEPNAPEPFNSDGSLNWGINSSGLATFENPFQYLYNVYSNKTSNLIGNSSFSYILFPFLELKVTLGYTNVQTNDFAGNPSVGINPNSRNFILPNALYGNRNLNSWIVEPQINYKKIFSKSKIDLLLGGTLQENNSNTNTIRGEDIVKIGS